MGQWGQRPRIASFLMTAAVHLNLPRHARQLAVRLLDEVSPLLWQLELGNVNKLT